jgi:hypothetical protein
MLIEKLQYVRNVIGKPMEIAIEVCCEAFNSKIKDSLVSSYMPDAEGRVLAMDIACKLLK